jgi:hypothetical protein
MKYYQIIFIFTIMFCLQELVGVDKFLIYLGGGCITSLLMYLGDFLLKKHKSSTEKK